jgi:hypothetical protein
LNTKQDAHGGGIGEQHAGEGSTGRFGEEGAVEVGLDEKLLFGCDGAEGVVVGLGEIVVGGGIFAGEDDGLSVDAAFQGVEAGIGLALRGAGAGGFPGVEPVGGDLGWSCHASEIARGKQI